MDLRTLEESLGAHSIKRAMERAEKKMSLPLPSLVNLGEDKWRTKMDKFKGEDVLIFLEHVKEMRIVPLQEYEAALVQREIFWVRLWDINSKKMMKLSAQKLKYSDKLSRMTRKVALLKERTTRNKNKIAEVTDLILQRQNFIREEENDWFRELVGRILFLCAYTCY